jgi:hypothetical protein
MPSPSSDGHCLSKSLSLHTFAGTAWSNPGAVIALALQRNYAKALDEVYVLCEGESSRYLAPS